MSDDEDAEAVASPSVAGDSVPKKKVIKPLTKEKLAKHLAAAENRGACAHFCLQRARTSSHTQRESPLNCRVARTAPSPLEAHSRGTATLP